MKKKVISFILAVAAMLSCTVAFSACVRGGNPPESSTVGSSDSSSSSNGDTTPELKDEMENFEYTQTETECIITGLKDKTVTKIVIPDQVTGIADCAFEECDYLMSVLIGNGVTSIGEDAFVGCYRLVEVFNTSSHITVEKGSEEHGEIARYALAVYNSDSGVTESKLLDDNGYIVYTEGAERILVGYTGKETDLVLPSYITKINPYAFYASDDLTSVEIPNEVTSIGAFAFDCCDYLMEIIFRDTTTWYRTYDASNWENKTGGEEIDFTDSYRNVELFYEYYYYYNFYKL